jgi:hypothetical protein
MSIQVHSITQKLDHIFDLSNRLTEDDELSAQYARYLCVLVSGYIEESIRLLLVDYAQRRSSPEILRYVRLKTKSVTNLKSSKIKELLVSFSEEWVTHYEEKVSDESIDAIDSVVANRHNIAHGKNTNISLGVVRNYYALVKPVIKELEIGIIKGQSEGTSA